MCTFGILIFAYFKNAVFSNLNPPVNKPMSLTSLSYNESPPGTSPCGLCSRPCGQIHMNSCVYPANTNGISIDFITRFVYNFVIKQGGVFMPAIKSSADLRNNYNEISTFCHNYPEPVFITKNGKGDLAVMSIEAYEGLTSRFELYSQIKEGMDDIATGNTRPFSEAMADIRSRRSR